MQRQRREAFLKLFHDEEVSTRQAEKTEQEFQGTNPLVSVLMTVWNGEAFLAEAIESVLAQETPTAWELIVVDDGSTDASAAIAKTFVARDKRVTLFSHPNGANCGISASRNLAMSKARGAVLAFLDADDVWLPYRLEHQLATWSEWPEAAMIYGGAERWWDVELPFDEHRLKNGANYIPPQAPPGERCGLLQPPTLLRWFLADEGFTPCTCSVLVRTTVARRVGGFEASFKGLYDDQVFYAKVALAEPVFADERCVARYRRHPGSCCWRAGDESTGTETESIAARREFLLWLSQFLRCESSFLERLCNQIGEEAEVCE